MVKLLTSSAGAMLTKSIAVVAENLWERMTQSLIWDCWVPHAWSLGWIASWFLNRILWIQDSFKSGTKKYHVWSKDYSLWGQRLGGEGKSVAAFLAMPLRLNTSEYLTKTCLKFEFVCLGGLCFLTFVLWTSQDQMDSIMPAGHHIAWKCCSISSWEVDGASRTWLSRLFGVMFLQLST